MSTFLLVWYLRRSADARSAIIGAMAYALVTALLLVTVAGAWQFTRWQDDLGQQYQFLAAFALVLLVVPLSYLGAAAARLSARAQDTRLSTLRLLGASDGQVVGVTVIGAAAEALVGALAGVVLYAAAVPGVGLLRFRGEALGGALWLPAWAVAAMVLAVAVMAAVSSVFGLRRVLVTPLGVRRRAVAQVPAAIRVVIAAVLMVGGILLMQVNGVIVQEAGIVGFVLLLCGVFAAALVALNALGPWVLSVWGRKQVRKAKTPDRLLAARTVLEDPKATWRQVSGAAMAGIVAVVGGAGAAFSAQMGDAEGVISGGDILTGVIVTLVIAFVGVACTTLVSQAATVLDRAELAHSLAMLGVPENLTTKARVRALMGPLVLVLLVAIAASGALLMPVLGLALLVGPTSLAVVAIVCVAGVLAVRGATQLAGHIRPKPALLG